MCVRRGIHIELSLLFITNGKLLNSQVHNPV